MLFWKYVILGYLRYRDVLMAARFNWAWLCNCASTCFPALLFSPVLGKPVSLTSCLGLFGETAVHSKGEDVLKKKKK